MDRHTLWLVAQQWQLLTRFAGDLPLPPNTNASDEAARYLRYHHDFWPVQWQTIQRFTREHRAELEGVEIDARVGRFAELEIGGVKSGSALDAANVTVAQQFRLLFGFAAQYTVKAAELVHLFLITWHNLGAPECHIVNEFLDAQEAWRADAE